MDRMKNQWDEIEVTIKMKCVKHFVPEFIAMLMQMEYNGKIGHSEWVGIYSDGDGALRPKFKFDAPQDVLHIAQNNPLHKERCTHFVGFDAG